MSNYFKSFPKVAYLFGDEDQPVSFQKLSQYSDLIDQFRDDVSAYLEYEIRDGDRPDTLSYRLYEKSTYDWTFFLMNETLRETGWPMTAQQVVDRGTNHFYKNYVARLQISTGDSASEFASIYPVGTPVLVSGKKGTVVRKNLNVGEIVISSDSDIRTGTTLAYQLPDSSDPLQLGASLTNTVYEWEGTHHYENDSGEWLDKYFDNLSGAVLKTNLDYLFDQNDASKRIRIIRKENVDSLVGELKRLLAID
jgi:hypothetical protein